MQRMWLILCVLVHSSLAVVLKTHVRSIDVNASASVDANTTAGRAGQSACPGCPCLHPKPTPPHKWAALSAMIHALNSLQAPYNIHGGTLLGLVRGCYIFDSDIDFVIEGWWLHQNHVRASQAFAKAGFHTGDVFGTLGKEGYEEAQIQKLASLLDMGTQSMELVHKDGMKVDLFTIQRFPQKYIWGLWVDGQYHPCTTMSTGVAYYDWLGLNVKIPTPVEVALTSLYGASYMTPRAWTWNVEPFTVGSCKGSPPKR